jgi:hypothetical protein
MPSRKFGRLKVIVSKANSQKFKLKILNPKSSALRCFFYGAFLMKWYYWLLCLFDGLFLDLLPSLFLVPLGLLIVPIALLFRREELLTATAFGFQYEGWCYVKLPNWAWLWDNDEVGAMGDYTWPLNCKNPSSYWSMFIWLAIRNPINNLQQVFGQKLDETAIIKYCGDRLVESTTYPHEGWHLVQCTCGGHTTYSFYLVKRYGKSDRCLRVRIGYKVKPDINIKQLITQRDMVGCAFIINPFMRYG